MKKTIEDYLSEISYYYGELRKDTYGEREGGGHKLPPSSNFFMLIPKSYIILFGKCWMIIRSMFITNI